jgi:hypothetical protein
VPTRLSERRVQSFKVRAFNDHVFCLPRFVYIFRQDGVAVVELWNHVQNDDVLLGLVKLPLHEFFLSLHDRQVCVVFFSLSQLSQRTPNHGVFQVQAAMLSGEYPVVALNEFRPVVNPFTGLTVARLHVLLALGAPDQVFKTKTIVLIMNLLIEKPRQIARISGHGLASCSTDSQTTWFIRKSQFPPILCS